MLKCQNVRKTSPPKNMKLMNMKNMSTYSSLYNNYSRVSSVFAPFPPSPGFPPIRCLIREVASGPEPNISSQVKFRVKSAGKRPIPIINPVPPPLFRPNIPLLSPA